MTGAALVELVAWLRKGGIRSEAPLLEALAAAPLPRKTGGGSASAGASVSAGAGCCCRRFGLPANW
jgi:hypothetical protein